MLLQFHFENMKLKAQQRIREGRQQPVDPLAVNLFLMPEFDASVSAPHAIFIGLTLSEVEDVRDEIMTWQVGSHWTECSTSTPRVATTPLHAYLQMPDSASSPLQAGMVTQAFLYETSASLCSGIALLASRLLLVHGALSLLAAGSGLTSVFTCSASFPASCSSAASVLQSLDYRNPERKDFWDALMAVADAELKEARKQDEVDRARLRGMREPDQDAREDTGVQAAVDIDVQIFLTGETPNVLAAQPVRQQSQISVTLYHHHAGFRHPRQLGALAYPAIPTLAWSCMRLQVSAPAVSLGMRYCCRYDVRWPLMQASLIRSW